MILANILFTLLLIFFFLLLGYQFILAVIAIGAKQKTDFKSSTKRRFAIVVPAHNEEKIISKTIYSLSGLIYPRKLYDVFVIADNCTDKTAEIASKLGANVLERHHETKKGKGHALRWAFDTIMGYAVARDKKSRYDAFIVVDSDSLVSGNYLEVMNHYLESGSRVIQSSDLVLRQPGNWSIEATRIGFMMYNYVKPLGRKALGFNMGLRGNGMCFHHSVFRKTPWQAWSLTEDVEYGLILLQAGEKIDFAPEATVWAQMPVQSSNAESQRSRWEMGRFQIIRAYAGSFFKQAITERSFSRLDTFLDLITPPFVNMMVITMAMIVLSVGLSIFGFLSPVIAGLWFTLGVMGFLYVFICLYVGGADKELYKSLLHLPKYIIWKIRLYLNTFRKGREVDWIRTERDVK
ncbi:MAG: glycosyltransferase family 2 protein [Balneolia bacterium]|nr:glycosyltransferase family 2 protein [Balneolia bacterium]